MKSNTPPDQIEMNAALAGLIEARKNHAWQAIRPLGQGTNDAAEQVQGKAINTSQTLRDDINETMELAQQRWPDATQWEVIGADTDNWQGAQTYAEFKWPALNQQPE